MSRRSYEDDLERRKEYLDRNLFQEVSILTPVREEEESFESPTTHAYPASAVITERPDSPWSPLPPLIIEREPNKHDEPEEHYEIFEKKIKKIYRRLFIEDRSDISQISDSDMSRPDNLPRYRRDNIDKISNDVRNLNLETDDIDKKHDKNDYEISSESDIDELPQDSLTSQDENGSGANKSDPASTGNLPRSNTADKITDVEKDRSSSTEIVLNIKDGVEIHAENVLNNDNTVVAISYESSRENDKSSTSDISTESSSASLSAGYKLISFRPDVHRNPEELIISRNSVEQIAERKNYDSKIDKNGLEKLKENYVSDTENHSDTSAENDDPQHIEVMRSTRNYPSTGSLHMMEPSDNSISNHDIIERPRSLEAEMESSEVTAINNKRKGSFSPSYPGKRVRYEDVSVQANLVDDWNGNIV